jgi:hypothetical protein
MMPDEPKAVREVREWRRQVQEDLEGMSPEAIIQYLNAAVDEYEHEAGQQPPPVANPKGVV